MVSNRYGRNQRRAHREAIKKLETEKAVLDRRAWTAERRASNAFDDGMTHAANLQPLLGMHIKKLLHDIVRTYEPKLKAAAEEMARHTAERRMPEPSLDVFTVFDMTSTVMVTEVQIRIPEFRVRARIEKR